MTPTPFKPRLAVHALTTVVILSACAETSSPEPSEMAASVPVLEERWVLDGFDAPESVTPTGTDDHYFVSNVGGGGSEKDGNGVISIIGGKGEMINRNWVSGTDDLPLHGPKGMAVWEGTLYVTDIDHLVLIDIETATLTTRIPIENAQFLNDVSASDQGVMVTDSGAAMILKLDDGAVTPWLSDDRLGGINGLLPQADRLLVTTMSAGELLSVDWDTKEITVLAGGMENADGVNQMGDGSYLISSWPGQLWRVREGEAPTLLQDTTGGEDGEGAILMNDVLLHEGQIIAPNWRPGTVRGYEIK